jgi:hypothetical protein
MADALGTYRGIVVANNDPQSRNRVQVQVPQILGTAVTDWAEPYTAYARKANIGENVWVVFEGGDVRLPIWSSPTVPAYIPPVPWKAVGAITADSAAILAGNVLDIVSATVTIPNVAVTDTKITVSWNGVLSNTTGTATTTDTLYDVRIMRDASQIFSIRIIGPTHNQTADGRSIVFTDVGPAPGLHTYTMNISHEASSTATDVTCRATSTTPTQITVEQL